MRTQGVMRNISIDSVLVKKSQHNLSSKIVSCGYIQLLLRRIAKRGY